MSVPAEDEDHEDDECRVKQARHGDDGDRRSGPYVLRLGDGPDHERKAQHDSGDETDLLNSPQGDVDTGRLTLGLRIAVGLDLLAREP